MKVIFEVVDGERYLEIVLSAFEQDLLDDYRLITKEIKIDKHVYQLSVRKNLLEEEKDHL